MPNWILSTEDKIARGSIEDIRRGIYAIHDVLANFDRRIRKLENPTTLKSIRRSLKKHVGKPKTR